MIICTPETHTGAQSITPEAHTGADLSHRNHHTGDESITPESICSAHTGISTQQNFAGPNSGVTLASQAGEIQRKVASKRAACRKGAEVGPYLHPIYGLLQDKELQVPASEPSLNPLRMCWNRAKKIHLISEKLILAMAKERFERR